jgi:AraC-like DNA-binding protein
MWIEQEDRSDTGELHTMNEQAENEKEFYSFEEVATRAGVSRQTLYRYVEDLGMKPHRFKRDKRLFLSQAETARVIEAIAKPWLLGERETKEPLEV